jgi:Pyridine nucleotide-disulphide oxidoreductase
VSARQGKETEQAMAANGTHDDGPLDVIVVGGSQAGLAMGWHLARQGARFAVLEAGPEIGHAWRSRWDSLTLFTPAQYDALPGMPFPGRPDTYPTKEPVADYLTAYAAAFNLPVRLNARVTHLSKTAEGFAIHTPADIFRARQVVVATGPFQVPFVPPAAQQLDGSVTQLHSAGYRNPQALPAGPVLVVGGGNSGFQIAEELAAAGRRVDLSIATRQPALPQRLAGKDLFWWLTRLRLMRVSTESRLGRRLPPRLLLDRHPRHCPGWAGHPPARRHRGTRPVLPGPDLAAHPRIGPAGVRPRRRRLPRRSHRRHGPGQPGHGCPARVPADGVSRLPAPANQKAHLAIGPWPACGRPGPDATEIRNQYVQHRRTRRNSRNQ